MKTATRKNWNKDAGQGTVEYLLVLVVTVSLVLGLMAQFYKPFNQWLTGYMGPYLQCLLDVGELPTFGSSGDSGLCATEFKAGNGIYSKSGNIPNTKSGSDSNSSENSSSSASNGSSHSGGGSSGGSSSGAYRVKGFPVGKARTADGPSEAESGGVVPLAQTKYYRSSSSSYGTLASRPGEVVGITGISAEDKAKKEKEAEKVFNAGSLGEGSSQKNKKLELKEPDRKMASEEKDTPWSFSSYLKFAVILMIVIAIVLFLGGQILQISKSMEK